MKSFAAFLLWTCVFLVLLIVLDQLLLHVRFSTPGLREIREFHLDFRNRLLHLPQGIEAARHPTRAEKSRPQTRKEAVVPTAPAGEAEKKSASGYVYADANGNLQFADSLDEIPPRFRRDARPMEP